MTCSFLSFPRAERVYLNRSSAALEAFFGGTVRQISDIYLAKVRQFSTAQSASCAFARTGRFPFFRVRFVMILLGGLCRLGGLDASWVMDGHGYNVIVSHEETCKIYVMTVFPCFKRNSGCADCSMPFLQAVKFGR